MQLVSKVELQENGASIIHVYKDTRFAIGDQVTLRLSGEIGEVVGIGIYRNESSVTPSYWVLYVDGTGKQQTGWVDELDLL